MLYSPVVLFPHTFVNDLTYQKLGSQINKLAIMQPWFMENPLSGDDWADKQTLDIKICKPLADMKPKIDFMGLLAEYRGWIREGIHKDSVLFLQNLAKSDISEAPPWEIRKLIKNHSETDSDKLDQQIIKWHLILHLAREMEANQSDSDALLYDLQQKPSPLTGLFDADSSKGNFLKYLPDTTSPPLMDIYHVHLIFEAWFGLFGNHMQEYEFLVTYDIQVIKAIAELFPHDEELFLISKTDKLMDRSMSDRDLPLKKVQLPPHTTDLKGAGSKIITGLSGKTIILIS